MDEKNQAARDFNPARDTLVALRPMRHGDRDLQAGENIPLGDFTDDRLRQFIRIGFAQVQFGTSTPVKVVVATVAPEPKPAAIVVDKVVNGFVCDVDGCKKPGPYKTKLNLGAHKRSHKKE